METTVTATELAKRLSDVLSRVRYRGERFVVVRKGDPVAVLGPAPPRPPAGITLRALAARLGDRDLPGDGFADDLEDVQATQRPADEPAWPS